MSLPLSSALPMLLVATPAFTQDAAFLRPGWERSGVQAREVLERGGSGLSVYLRAQAGALQE